MIRTAVLVALAASFAMSTPASAEVFDFEDLSSGTAAPFTSTDGSLTASFVGDANVCDVSSLSFSTLSGNAAITNFCGVSGPPVGLSNITFSQVLSSLSLNYALSGPGTFSVDAFLNNNSVFSQSYQPGGQGGFPEGTVAFNALFDQVQFSSSAPAFAYDNMNVTTAAVGAVPEPSTWAMMLIGFGIIGAAIRRRRIITRSFGLRSA